MAVYLPVRSISRSQNVRVGQQTLTNTTTAYVDINDGPTRRDLQHHLALGAVLVVGGLTNTNSDAVVLSGGAVTAGTGLTVNVSAGQLKVRSTGAVVDGASATNFALSSSTIGAGNSRIDLIWWDNATGAVGKTDGTVAVTASAVAPTTPAGKVPLATVAVANGASAPGTITDVRPRS